MGKSSRHCERLRPILSRLPGQQPAEVEKSISYIETDKVLYTQSRLPRLDATSEALWQALHSFGNVTEDYASLPVPHPIREGQSSSSCPMSASIPDSILAHLLHCFHWPELPLDIEGSWYGVLFHSIRKANSENHNFYEADRRAHEEAVRSGGLIMYWYGVPDPVTGTNLATCIWTSRRDAIEASRLPLHAIAVKFAGPSYSTYGLIRYKLVKHRGTEHLDLEAW